MRLTDEMVKLDDQKYHDRNTLAELKYMGREIKHRKTVTNDDLHFMAWLCRYALNLLTEQEAIKPTINEYGEAYCVCGENVGIIPSNKNLPSIRSKYCPECGRRMNWDD